MSLTVKIFIAMLGGILLGSLTGTVLSNSLVSANIANVIRVYFIDGFFDVIGTVFIASLKLLIVPMVFVSLVCGASTLGDSARMGPIALKAMSLYLGTTAVAVSVALGLALLVDPGENVSLDISVAEYAAPEPPPLKQVLIDIFPENPVAAMVEGNMLQIIVFALLVGYTISRSGEPGRRIGSFFRDFETVIMRLVLILMELAPIGVFALLTKLFAEMGFTAILDLAAYFLTVLAVLLLHGGVTYSLLLKGFTGLSPLILWHKLRPVWAVAFSTASSGATMPVTLRVVERQLGVHNSVAGFTVPVGTTINMDGTAALQGVATVFIAQIYGIDLSVIALLTVVLTATLASVGTAAVPGVGVITLAMVLEQVGIPVEGIALIIGVDRLLDMVRTTVNVTGDATVSLIVGHSEEQWDEDVFHDPHPDPAAE